MLAYPNKQVSWGAYMHAAPSPANGYANPDTHTGQDTVPAGTASRTFARFKGVGDANQVKGGRGDVIFVLGVDHLLAAPAANAHKKKKNDSDSLFGRIKGFFSGD